MVNGLLGSSRNIKSELLKYVQFIGYAVYEPNLPLYDQWKLIQNTNITSVLLSLPFYLANLLPERMRLHVASEKKMFFHIF